MLKTNFAVIMKENKNMYKMREKNHTVCPKIMNLSFSCKFI